MSFSSEGWWHPLYLSPGLQTRHWLTRRGPCIFLSPKSWLLDPSQWLPLSLPPPCPADPCLCPHVQRPLMCWGTIRRSPARSPRGCAARVTPAPTTTTARTGGGAPGSTNTGPLGPAGQPWEEGGSRQIRAEAACTVLPGVGGREASPGGRRTPRAVGMFRRAKRSFGVKSGSFH